MLIADRDLRLVEANALFWDAIGASEAAEAGVAIERALPEELFEGIKRALDQVLEVGTRAEVQGVRVYTAAQPHRVLDLRCGPATMGGERVIILLADAVPDTGRRVAELTLLHDMIRVLRQETKIERVLFATLTCATAGSGGLGFNRAWMLLTDPAGEGLEGRMALGPCSAAEAHRIWAEVSSQPRTLEDFTAAYDRWAESDDRPLQDVVSRMRFSLAADADELPALAALQRRPIKVDDAEHDERVSDELRQLIGASEFVVVPMLVSDQACGVIMADNLYSGAPITHGHIRLLALFAQHAGIAIENAQAYHEIEARERELSRAYATLKRTHDELVRAKQLAALGEMSARVAHDLRNPLVTIGGWARALTEEPDDPHAVRRVAAIIAEETSDLEQILSVLLEPLAGRRPEMRATDLGRLISDALAAQQNELAERKVRLELDLAPDLPQIRGDPSQLRRCLLNLVDNALNAMPEGGTLTVAASARDRHVSLRIADTGVGMPQEITPRIFDAFFTTGPSGSGLGLAVVWNIAQSHGCTIEVDSTPGEGTSFTILFPLNHGPASPDETADDHTGARRYVR